MLVSVGSNLLTRLTWMIQSNVF